MSYPYPNISKKSKDKFYKPNMDKLISYGKNLNINLNALKFDHFTNYEHFLNNGGYTNPRLNGDNFNLTNTNNNIKGKIDTANDNLLNANLGREYQLKTEELLQLENKDLNKQFAELERLQTNIFSKERLIEDNMVQTSNYETGIRALSASILFGALLFLTIYLYGKNTMNPGLLRSIGVLLIVIYILVIFYIYNVMYLQESINNIFSMNFLAGIGSELQKKTDEINSKWGQLSQDKYNTWVQNNCSCPTDTGASSSSSNTNDSGKLTVMEEEQGVYSEEVEKQGLYYQDGSSPNQLLYPPNTRENSGKYRERIDYPDYSINYSDFPETRSSSERFENRQFGTTDIETQEEEEIVNIFDSKPIKVSRAPLVGDNVYTNGL